ncbi:hypothetical protein COCVIDRAFT_39481 [Bipolaris victoriae FI3]|uniref:Uncharacterized protein n=1 Tax=Bipolaris victoriae (strain FI3) TaxID=930091 RepID=W7E3P2_BIPV3|nr:hypothetical protein COCVIDRAFT_39481 [Bipolaris victoriae FI3]
MGQSTPGDMFRGSLLGVSSGLIPRPNCTVASPLSRPPTRPSVHPALEQFATTHQTTIAGRARGPPPFRAGAPRSTPLATVDHVTHRCLLSTHFHIPTCTTHFIRAYTSACMHTSSPMSG